MALAIVQSRRIWAWPEIKGPGGHWFWCHFPSGSLRSKGWATKPNIVPIDLGPQHVTSNLYEPLPYSPKTICDSKTIEHHLLHYFDAQWAPRGKFWSYAFKGTIVIWQSCSSNWASRFVAGRKGSLVQTKLPKALGTEHSLPLSHERGTLELTPFGRRLFEMFLRGCQGETCWKAQVRVQLQQQTNNMSKLHTSATCSPSQSHTWHRLNTLCREPATHSKSSSQIFCFILGMASSQDSAFCGANTLRSDSCELASRARNGYFAATNSWQITLCLGSKATTKLWKPTYKHPHCRQASWMGTPAAQRSAGPRRYIGTDARISGEKYLLATEGG